MAPSLLLPHWQLLLLLLTPPLALAPRPTCPSGASPVGDSSLYGCVDAATGGLALLGGTVAAEGAAPAASFAVAVQALSTISGCTESAASSTELSTAAGLITATRKLSCGADATWHPDAAVRHATVTDSFFVNAAPNGEGRQLPSLGWNATWSSAEAEMWTAPLSSSLTLANFSTTAPPRVWVGGPSTSTAVLSPTFSPLAPIPLGHCDGTKCSAEPQPCPGHKGRTFCTSNSSSGQCDSPSAPCPPCPQSAAAGTCEYWYGGALTDLQWRQNLIDNHAQNKELLDAPSLALPIVCENGRFLPFILKTIVLPRQARDKRWKTQTRLPVSQVTLLDSSTAAQGPRGVSFLQSAHDHPVSMRLTTRPLGGEGNSTTGAAFVFSRQYHRCGAGMPLRSIFIHVKNTVLPTQAPDKRTQHGTQPTPFPQARRGAETGSFF